jgi:hypothetical protein
VTVKQAYLAMFEYLDRYWNERQKPDEVGDILSALQLWDSSESKRPMDSSIFPEWLDCVRKVVPAENNNEGYRDADIKFV